MDEYVSRRPGLSVDSEWSFTVSTKYQWLPSDFSVSSSSEVECLGYTNNIHPIHHASLYPPITAIIARFVPMFERVLSDALSADSELAAQLRPYEWYEEQEEEPDDLETEEQWDAWEREHKWPTIPDPKLFQPQPASERVNYSLKDRKIQVIVKLANIVLTPKNPKYFEGGAWHVDGMANENIVATGLYYYACENVTESWLDFRTVVAVTDTVPFQQDDHRGLAVAYGFIPDFPQPGARAHRYNGGQVYRLPERLSAPRGRV